MLNLPDQQDFIDLPFIRMIATAYAVLSMLIIPAGYLIILLLIPAQLRSFKTATDPYEKTFRRLRLMALILIIYDAIAFALCLIDSPWKLAMSCSNTLPVDAILEMTAILIIAFGAILISAYFGRADKKHMWHKPDWLAMKYHLNQVIIDNDIILDRDPSLQFRFAKLPKIVQRQKMHEWEQEVDTVFNS